MNRLNKMKKSIYFALLLVSLVILHDTVYAERNNLPFALTDFGWMIHNYVPAFENFLIDNLSQDFRVKYLAPLFSTKTLFVALAIGGFFVLLAIVHAIKTGKSILKSIPIVSLFFKEKNSEYARHNYRKNSGRFKYKSKD